MRHLLTVVVLIFWVTQSMAQSPLPIVKATSKTVSIRDGKDFHSATWTLVPELRPDIYHSSKLGERVTFYTDIDSISVDLRENTKFDFVILLNGKDSAFTQIAYREPYLTTLKKAAEYDNTQRRNIPKFTYAGLNDVDLQKIRKAFNLDSIAGKGSEASKFINMMDWVHNIVRHDGNSRNPKLQNAIDLIKVCQNENRGINCRMMATVLNECYLAMGFKSRMVTCMPKPLKFQDCHVINAVYSNELGKWVWMDPTFSAYVMDEKGELLGIQEVRERLVNDKPLILNPDANWNRRVSQTKEHYLYEYMAKNLYRLEVPVRSAYDVETNGKDKTVEYVQLLPLDGINQKPEIRESKYKSGMVLRFYITNNPKQFWEMTPAVN
ncbi:hypothetical protein FUAX_39690 (plasmid) [Fulvitalea axinellae]|uniref:Transglutaminase-like domain-containing protein n=1 Tax=Fulvitalea axinellae TaxID=1182444 RepID=A0AAU9CWW9_9BACT|nr:hypothetical protein FUAX_39690 [Fulvitalea axinellae]